jgi:hypothetical protein
MMVGAATAAAVVAIKRRREILGSMGFMAKYYAQPAIRMRVKILSGLNCPVRFTARRLWSWRATILIIHSMAFTRNSSLFLARRDPNQILRWLFFGMTAA